MSEMNSEARGEDRGEDRGGGRRESSPFRRRSRRKVCRFCADKVTIIDFKDTRMLSSFLSEQGKIIPSRITGTCQKCQRMLRVAIKRARASALLPFTAQRR